MPRLADAVPSATWSRVAWLRFALWLAAGIALVVSGLLAWRQIEEFLIRDDRFRVAEPEEFGGQSPGLQVDGVRYASLPQIRHVFAGDLGRSLLLVPAEARRRELLTIDWVQQATVSKQWPNRLCVTIVERAPVAFVHMPPNRRDGASQFALIDRDGFILRPRVAARFTLPVIAGITESEDQASRRIRVRRVLAMLKELGRQADSIAEVDASDLENMVVTAHVENRVFKLLLGAENFNERMNNFLANYKEIELRRPDAGTLDLRVDNVITAAGEQQLHVH